MTFFEVVQHGDLHGTDEFSSLEEALDWIESHVFPDPEDDRIVIWEVLDSGHRKVVWHFSGWHWDSNGGDLVGGPLAQGKLRGHSKSYYDEVMEKLDGPW